jgi:hypothetical protein
MPYKSEKIKLPKELDRRVKLKDKQREEIRNKYATGLYSQRTLAKEYNVSRRLITFILDEEKQKRNAELLKERKLDGRYKPTKEEWAKTVREHRKYKQELYLQGKLKEDNE